MKRSALVVFLFAALAPMLARADSVDDINAGIAAHDRGDLDAAIQYYTTALQEGGITTENEAICYNDRGIVYDDKGQYDQAISDYSEAVRLNPNYHQAFNNRGLAYDSKGEYQKAIDDFSEAIRQKPDYYDAFNNRGYAYDDNGQYDEAIADYTDALRLKPDFMSVYFHRGLAYDYKGKYDLAIADETSALKLQPDYRYAFVNRAMSYEHAGEFDQSVADYSQTLKLKDSDVYAFRGRGRVYFYQGKFKDAVTDFEHAIALDSGDEYALIWRYLSQTRAGVDGKADLTVAAAKLKDKSWPYPIISYYLGTTSGDDLLVAAKNPNPSTQADQECGADTYLAEGEALHKNKAAAIRLFKQAQVECSPGGVEVSLASEELKRLNKPVKTLSGAKSPSGSR